MKKTTKLKRIFLNKKALSPAIATALLLVITIALVAAVSYAATNIAPSNKNINTPKAVFSVTIVSAQTAEAMPVPIGGMPDYGSITIQEISGDSINSANLEMVLTDTAPSAVNVESSTITDTGTATFSAGSTFNLALSSGDVSTTGTITPSGTWTGAGTLAGTFTATIPGSTATIAGTYSGNVPTGDVTTSTGETVDVVLTITGTPPTSTTTYVYPCTSASVISTCLSNNAADTSTSLSPQGPNVSEIGSSLIQGVAYPYTIAYQAPWLYNPSTGPADSGTVWFGQYNIVPGSVMKADGIGIGQPQTSGSSVTGSDDTMALISNFYSLVPGDIVSVSMIYTPSNQVIWQGDVTVG